MTAMPLWLLWLIYVYDFSVPEPQLDAFVVAKCERATRPLFLDGSRQSAGFDSRQYAILACLLSFLVELVKPLHLGYKLTDYHSSGRDDHFQMVPGDLCILRYRPFQEELMTGNISLVWESMCSNSSNCTKIKLLFSPGTNYLNFVILQIQIY